MSDARSRLFGNIVSLDMISRLARLVPRAAIYPLKGAAVAILSNAALARRRSEDIDILVPDVGDRDIVFRGLKEMGFVKRRRDPQTYDSPDEGGRSFDVHDGLWYASPSELKGILSRAGRAEGFDGDVRIFDPVDLAADIVIHAYQHGFADERWREDLAAMDISVEDGFASARRYCSGVRFDGETRGRIWPKDGFRRRFAALGGGKKAAYVFSVMFPPPDFIRRRYDCASGAEVFLRAAARPLETAAAGAAAVLSRARLFLRARQ